MDPELRDLLEETHALAKDNHRMLRAVRRSQWLSFLSTIIIWVVVLALPLYLYKEYLAPTIDKISELSGVSTTTTSGFLGLPTSTDIQKLIDSYTEEQ
ncbi:MAG: hypothetical protein WC798_01095 [Candidatus Paceibacterota bacterium]|jgi:hypothetical protein